MYGTVMVSKCPTSSTLSEVKPQSVWEKVCLKMKLKGGEGGNSIDNFSRSSILVVYYECSYKGYIVCLHHESSYASSFADATIVCEECVGGTTNKAREKDCAGQCEMKNHLVDINGEEKCLAKNITSCDGSRTSGAYINR